MLLSLDTVKAVYRRAIDATASDYEGSAWWEEVATEIRAVVQANSLTEAADVIDWWHADWRQVSDTARAAARRIRAAARAV